MILCAVFYIKTTNLKISLPSYLKIKSMPLESKSMDSKGIFTTNL